jgi:hypothetical protein
MTKKVNVIDVHHRGPCPTRSDGASEHRAIWADLKDTASNRAITVTTESQGNLYHHNKLDKKNQQKGKKKEMITSNCTFTNIHLKYTLNALG